MRWDSLFADLGAQLEAEERLTFEADLADLTRAEFAELSLAERLRAHQGQELNFWLLDGVMLTGRPTDVGADWVLLAAPRGGTVVPLQAVVSVAGLSRAAEKGGSLAARLSLRLVLRGLARDRSPITVWAAGGISLTGTIDRVGADHLDLAVHPLDVPRLPTAVGDVRCLPLAGLVRISVD